MPVWSPLRHLVILENLSMVSMFESRLLPFGSTHRTFNRHRSFHKAFQTITISLNMVWYSSGSGDSHVSGKCKDPFCQWLTHHAKQRGKLDRAKDQPTRRGAIPRTMAPTVDAMLYRSIGRYRQQSHGRACGLNERLISSDLANSLIQQVFQAPATATGGVDATDKLSSKLVLDCQRSIRHRLTIFSTSHDPGVTTAVRNCTPREENRRRTWNGIPMGNLMMIVNVACTIRPWRALRINKSKTDARSGQIRSVPSM